MAKPTEKEYQDALKTAKLYAEWIDMTRERIDDLIDQIIDLRETQLCYQSSYNEAREIVERYKIYEELEREKKI